jgi:GxxExxY protein
MERCPTCRARLKGQTQCHRCGTDLTLALQAESRAKQWMQQALRYFSEGAFDDAEAALDRARMLHQTPLVLALRPFFRTHKALGALSTTGAVVLKPSDETRPARERTHPLSPVVETGRRLLQVLTGGSMPGRAHRLGEPDGLVVWLEDACGERSHHGRIGFRIEALIKNIAKSVTRRRAEDHAKPPETAPAESLQSLKDAIRAAAIVVHRSLGPGLPASVYEECLCRECERSAIPFKRRAPIAVKFKDASIDSGYRANLLLADKLIVMIEGADTAGTIDRRQALNYLCSIGWKAGLVIDFNVAAIQESEVGEQETEPVFRSPIHDPSPSKHKRFAQ